MHNVRELFLGKITELFLVLSPALAESYFLTEKNFFAGRIRREKLISSRTRQNTVMHEVVTPETEMHDVQIFKNNSELGITVAGYVCDKGKRRRVLRSTVIITN